MRYESLKLPNESAFEGMTRRQMFLLKSKVIWLGQKRVRHHRVDLESSGSNYSFVDEETCIRSPRCWGWVKDMVTNKYLFQLSTKKTCVLWLPVVRKNNLVSLWWEKSAKIIFCLSRYILVKCWHLKMVPQISWLVEEHSIGVLLQLVSWLVGVWLIITNMND